MNANTSTSNVAYIFSPSFVQICSRGTKVKQRLAMVHSLINSYGLLEYMKIVCPNSATQDELCRFHSVEYVDFLQKVNDDDIERSEEEEEASQFGFGYDCPLFRDIYEYVSTVAGGTLAAAQCLTENTSQVAINWGGGWHHAKKDEAAGFCYVNDIVLGIIKLLEKFRRVLYIDLDAHHGDGVEDAFAFTSKVMCVSLHKHDYDFYPRTGSVDDVGYGKGRFYSVNLPLKDGIRDENYYRLFSQVLDDVGKRFRPDVVVCQCGADLLIGDPVNAGNVTPQGFGKCISYLLEWKLPTLFLGGGGYDFSNTARLWAYLTSIIISKTIPNDIPDHLFFTYYGPGFELSITAGNRCDKNDENYLNELLHKTKEKLKAVEVIGEAENGHSDVTLTSPLS